MIATKTGNFPLGFRQGWTEWFKDIPGMISWAKSNDIGVIDVGGDVEIIKQVHEAGIRIGSADLKSWHDLISEDVDARKAAVDANIAHFEACGKLGVNNYFTVMLPKDPAKKRSENFAIMLESLNALAPALKANGGKIVIEGWPGAGALCCTPADYRACLEQTPAEIGVNFDPSHLIRMGIDPMRFLNEAGGRVYHVHGKDCIVDAEAQYNLGTEQPATFAKNHDFGNAVWRYTIPGHGQTPWKQVLDILVGFGYQGAISIELEDENFNGTEAGEKLGILQGTGLLASI